MSAVRPPEHLVHGLNGVVVVLDARVCAYLNRYAGLQDFHRANRGLDPQVDAALTAMRVAELHWSRSATGTVQAAEPELARTSEWLSTTEVAARLWMSSRGVRKAIAEGRLQAEQVAGRWRVSREAFAHFKASRDTNGHSNGTEGTA